jgi:hypothetical protein
MMLRTAKLGLGIVTLGLAMAVAPLALAGASQDGLAASGPTPTAAVCSLVKSEQTAFAKVAKKQEKNLGSKSIAKVKAASLIVFTADVKAENAVIAQLGSAPASIQAAAATSTQLNNKLKSVIQSATSISGLQAAETKAEKDSKTVKAEKVLNAFFNKCK